MTWTKLSDDFSDDCWTLSDAAVRLHVDGLVWSNRKLLDCQIPKDDLARVSRAAGAVDELISVGWWSDAGEHYVIRHHAVYQRTREQVVAIQERNRTNGRKHKPGREREPAAVTQMGSEVGSDLATHRDGTGLDGLGNYSPTEVSNDCGECKRRHVFGSGACPAHRQMTA